MVIKGRCADASADCEYWMREGECQRNQLYMSEECPLSCNFCKDGQAHPCVDDERCAGWAKDDHCVRNRRFMCASSPRAHSSRPRAHVRFGCSGQQGSYMPASVRVVRRA